MRLIFARLNFAISRLFAFFLDENLYGEIVRTKLSNVRERLIHFTFFLDHNSSLEHDTILLVLDAHSKISSNLENGRSSRFCFQRAPARV